MKRLRSVALQAFSAVVVWTTFLPVAGHAITVAIRGGSGDPGGPVEVQVSMAGGNRMVAGVQVDLVWDASCLSAIAGDDGGASCAVGPAVGKQLSTKIRNASTMRALLLSLSDVDPIEQDGVLFTCVFDIRPGTTATQCRVTLQNLILSDSKGGRLRDTAVNGGVRINQPTPQPQVTAGGPAGGSTPGVAVPGVAPVTSTSEGCAMAPAGGDAGLLWLLVLPLIVLRRPRARQCGGAVG